MNCAKCNNPIDENESFCAVCGASSEDQAALKADAVALTMDQQRLGKRRRWVILAIAAVVLLVTGAWLLWDGYYPFIPYRSNVYVYKCEIASVAEAGGPVDNTPIAFTDAHVEAQVRELFGKATGDITVGDMHRIRSFVHEVLHDKSISYEIKSLDDFRYCSNLEVICVNSKTITNLEGLRNLPNLENVSIVGTSVSDLSPLAGKKYLKEVFICATQVKDASPVLALNSLELFNADNTVGITDISALRKTHNLKYFLYNYKLADYTPLFSHKDLEHAWLSGISDIEFIGLLANCKKLSELRIESSPIQDVSLNSLRNHFQILSFRSCGIRDISALSHLSNLFQLELLDNKIEDLTPLAGLKHIEFLSLCNNNIRDYSPLKNLTELVSLDVTGNPVTDDETLRALEAKGCRITRSREEAK